MSYVTRLPALPGMSRRRRAFSALAALVSCTLHAAPLKVDLNMVNRADAADSAFVRWDVVSGPTNTRTFDDVTVTFTHVPPVGVGLRSDWHKDTATSPTLNAKMVGDGLTVDGGNAGAKVEMRLRGLAPGRHTLLTYHNTWQNPLTNTFSPIHISLNGEQAITGLMPSNRVTDNADAPTAYLEFDAVAGEDIVVLFEADTSSSATAKNVTICGFELDTENTARLARRPSPADGDEHVDGDSGSALLSWRPAPSAVEHRVYFGTDLEAVVAATPESPEYRGAQIETTFLATDLNSHAIYYWRIDEVDSAGYVAKGDIWYFRIRHLAFPGAEGYGRFARGGRGGRVIEVTNLNDSGPGSLRAALEATGPRTVVFAVGGLITLESRIVITDRYVTIAGQTAPGLGICIRKYNIGLSGAKDVIIRHLRVRPGDIGGVTIDGMGMQGSDHSIIDHCSISWSIDEAFSSRSAQNITLQRTLISEALNAAGHQNYPPGTRHGYAASIGGDIGSFHHNLLAHCYGRNWSLAGGLDGGGAYAGRLDIRNNVVYNWGTRATDGGAMEVNFVNNLYQPGPATTWFYALNAQYEGYGSGMQRYYTAGNVMPGRFDESNQSIGMRATASGSGTIPTYEYFVSAPFFPHHVDTQGAGSAYKRVLSDVGSNRPQLDPHDVRMIAETLTGTFTYRGSVTGLPGHPDSQDDVGGWDDYPAIRRPATWDTDHDGLPDWWEGALGLNANSAPGDFSDSNADPDGDGYTQLDDYLAWLAKPNVACVPGLFVDVDLASLTRGYTAAPRFAVSGAVNGTVRLRPDGRTARFTPKSGFTGLAEFTFRVTDAAGDSMSDRLGVRVGVPPAP